ncbi:MAG: 50S ribosomal protein L23 [Candidatus Magasanikbacteria bacterium RIFOXYC2_FULL_42_28]|uniref:Large ribosomal subunit protein uL23 n=1 Tax=Candidatus Magasanikbacteria bacterium RIFOXYC2_FULL_42_28 TaxID=1798704 RepID=A0A1F6NUP5_9BACT|nr:MAG: 50S ribosomal protein L23 [Candidatus Magasanikbacteria bacterium RIFOXYC2_FULL_42_28]
MTADRILIRPLVTEKGAIAQSQNKYGFVVERSATTDVIKRAIAEAYGVTPLKVNLINVSGKWVRFGQSFGRRGDYKKAIVTLPKGKSITIHEGV